ncbi:MAG: hypothetical protein GX643_08580 [Acidimicrobiales bacterium]|nr:hypothetical protein [Acidimicrobiales bacterium]
MRRRFGSRLGRLTACGVIGLSLLTTACSDDASDAASPTSETDAPTGWCEAARRVENAIPTKRVEASRESAALAPAELQPDYEVLHEWMEFSQEFPTDAVGIAERMDGVPEALARIAEALKAECGFAPAL